MKNHSTGAVWNLKPTAEEDKGVYVNLYQTTHEKVVAVTGPLNFQPQLDVYNFILKGLLCNKAS